MQVDITLGKLQHLRIRIQTPEGPETLLEGELYQRVQPFGSGSFWELVRLDGVTHLVVTFEKANSVKRQSYMQPHPTGFWKSVIKGHPQIDVDKVAVTR